MARRLDRRRPREHRDDRGKYRHYLEAGRLVAAETLLLPDNVDRAVASLGVTGAIDLLSVDVDGNDLALIEALECVRPRVVVAEYNNARYGASVRWRMPFDAGHRWTARNTSALRWRNSRT